MTWSYDLADAQFDFLAVGETLVLTYTATVNDGHGGVVSAPITVTVTGTNDAPAITTIAQQDLDEQTDTNALTATIAVTFTDVDLTDVGHTAEVTQAVASGVTTGLLLDEGDLIGLMTVGAVTKTSGSSSGSLNLGFAAASTAFDYLADGEVLTLTYTVAVDDHDGGTTPQTFVVTITGSNDDPVVATSDLTGTVLEAVTPGANLTDTGTTAFSDVDLTDTHDITTIVPSSGALGVLTASVTTDSTGSGLGGIVTWNYSVAASAVEYLAKDEIKTEQFTITLDDGNGGTIDRIIEVTITGTNDDPVVATSDLTGAVLEAVTPGANLTDTGTIAFSDVDLIDGHTIDPTIVASAGDARHPPPPPDRQRDPRTPPAPVSASVVTWEHLVRSSRPRRWNTSPRTRSRPSSSPSRWTTEMAVPSIALSRSPSPAPMTIRSWRPRT